MLVFPIWLYCWKFFFLIFSGYDNTFIWALKEPRCTWAGGIGCGSGGGDAGGGGGGGGGDDFCCGGGGSDTGGRVVVVMVIVGVRYPNLIFLVQ